MNKIIAILLIFVLCSCTTEYIKTSELSTPPSDTTAFSYQQKSKLHSRFHIDNRDTASNTEDESLSRITRYLKQGVASWYGSDFHGKKTASGEIYDMNAMTAAHKTLPLSSYARITNLENQRSVIVRINDRGPFRRDRVLDLSYAAAKKLDIHQSGTGAVEIKAIAPEQALTQLQNTAEIQENSVYLQIGTFGNKKNAQKLQNKGAANHLPEPDILASKHQGSTLYKVQMGPIQSAESVDKLNLQLAKLGITATQFVTETGQKQISMIQ
jgi:rare lipoprotein A